MSLGSDKQTSFFSRLLLIYALWIMISKNIRFHGFGSKGKNIKKKTLKNKLLEIIKIFFILEWLKSLSRNGGNLF